ncbi:MAG: hypothetical protein ACI8WB_001408 [Phenylobacterium sp.]|jgi:hypothetical protein
MKITRTIPDFGFSTEKNQAHEKFGQTLGIQAFVEAYDDIRFWTEEFNKFELEINAQEISRIKSANGKDAILTAIKEQRIILGSKTIICIDTDYDYLLNKNSSIYQNDFCFQTWAFAIENYYYNPVGLTHCCCTAVGVYQGVDKQLLENVLVNWSKYIYGCFLQRLVDDKNIAALKDTIVTSIKALTIEPTQSNEATTHSLSDAQLKDFTEKGLCSENVFLYFRGHDLESKIIELAEAFVYQLSEKAKADIKTAQGDNASQFISEQFNNRLEFKVLAKARPAYPMNHCYALLQNDIQIYKKQYC